MKTLLRFLENVFLMLCFIPMYILMVIALSGWKKYEEEQHNPKAPKPRKKDPQ